jgi:hypothetical protein
MKKMMPVTLFALVVGLFALALPAVAQSPDCTGTYQTRFGAVNGRGAGSMQMSIAHRGSSLVWNTSTGYTYVCSLSGTRCSGTWTGRTGAGWFAVNFSGNGSSFSGTWGYGEDRSASAFFTGTRM